MDCVYVYTCIHRYMCVYIYYLNIRFHLYPFPCPPLSKRTLCDLKFQVTTFYVVHVIVQEIYVGDFKMRVPFVVWFLPSMGLHPSFRLSVHRIQFRSRLHQDKEVERFVRDRVIKGVPDLSLTRSGEEMGVRMTRQKKGFVLSLTDLSRKCERSVLFDDPNPDSPCPCRMFRYL